MFNHRYHIISAITLGDFITVRTKCPFCTEERNDEFPSAGYNAWVAGVNIQEAMPTVSKDLREILISGICPRCWDETFR